MIRSEQIARAEHELRGAATALALVCEALRRDPSVRHHGAAIDAQLDRLRAGLADLEAARTGKSAVPMPEPVELSSLTRAAVEFAWLGGPVPVRLDRRRFAQALGNVLANAAEHGAGDVRVIGRAHEGGVSVEVINAVDDPPATPSAGRGRGLLIASGAAEELGGHLSFEIAGDSAVATLELPDA